MDAKELVDIICPKHDRASCDDNHLDNGFYSNEGYTRCLRCTLLEIIERGKLLASHKFGGGFIIDEKQADQELRGKR
jgi:hypothetical protein